MRSIIYLTILFLTLGSVAGAQDGSAVPGVASDTAAPAMRETVSAVPVTGTKLPPFTAPAKGGEPDAAAPVQQTQNGYVRPDRKTRFRRYINSMVGPVSLGKNVATAAWGTWRNSPEEWGDNWEGFGRRFASGLGKGAIKHTAIYALDESLKLDSRFYRSTKKDFGSRLGNALISPVTARTASGKRVIGVPRLVGTYASSIIAREVWYPDRFDYKDGIRSGTISLGISAAFNVFKEFVWK